MTMVYVVCSEDYFRVLGLDSLSFGWYKNVVNTTSNDITLGSQTDILRCIGCGGNMF